MGAETVSIRDFEALAERRVGATVADRYTLRSVLGVGGMGAVYEAHHRFTDRRVALKLLHPQSTSSSSASKRFLQEARIVGAVRHPAIADVLDAGTDDDGTHYVVFELLEGEELGQVLRTRALDVGRALDLAVDILAGLAVAHEHDVVHRDVKPANIFLLREPTNGVGAKLLDFGVARLTGSDPPSGRALTQAGMVVGTPNYMSPEQMCGEAIDGRADLWAVAVVVFLSLTQRLPFRAKNVPALLAEMLNEGPPSILAIDPELPASLGAVLTRALDPEIERRYPDARAMSAAFEAVRLERGGEATRSPRSEAVTDLLAPVRTTPVEPASTPRPAWEQALEDIEAQIERLDRPPPEPETPKKKRFSNPFSRKK